MENEVNPTSGEIEVSLNAEETGAEVAPATVHVQETPASTEPKKRGRGVDLSKLAPGELKAHKKAINDKAQKNRRDKKKSASTAYNSTVEVAKSKAREILRDERNIRNPRILDICVELAQVASRNLKIPFNTSLFTKGLQGTLTAARGETPPAFPADEWHAGERVREHELWATWDYSTSWRTQPDGTQLSFEDWKAYRRSCITGVVWFGNTVLGKDFQPEPHGRWATELFPQLEPALLSLPEEFGQKDIAKAFRALSDVRQRCLISARSSFKSTFSTCFMLALMLAFAGSLRMLVTTATQPLARGFAKSFKNILTVRDPNHPSLFNQLWPEHCIDPDDGKALEYTSPFRQLDVLIEPTLFITSVISEGQAGSRYDYGDFDDCAEISKSSNVEMRAKTQERIDMLRELGEPHSLTTYVGTPISQGAGTDEDPGDLYSVLLRREEKNKKEDGDPKLLYTICPAWTVKSGVRKKAWDPTLTPVEVDLLFPARLSFSYLMAKLKENLATDKSAKIFRQQSLVSWVPDEESDLLCQFDHDTLYSRVRPASYFSAPLVSQTVMSLDRAFSISKYADFSCAIIGRRQPVDGKEALVVIGTKMDRLRTDGLVKMVADLIEKYRPTYLVAEQDRGWEDFRDALRKLLMLRNIQIPTMRFKLADNSERAKARRVHALQLPISDGRIWFASSSGWDVEPALLQLEKFDGITPSNSHRHDDWPDALGLLHSEFGVRYQAEIKQENPEDAEKRKQEAEEEYAREQRRAYHDRMHGGAYTPPPKAEQPPPAPQQPAPRFPSGAGNFNILPPGMRGINRR
jgi:hypothetical protein